MFVIRWVNDKKVIVCTNTAGSGTWSRCGEGEDVEIINFDCAEIPTETVKPDIQYGPRRKRGKGKYHKY